VAVRACPFVVDASRRPTVRGNRAKHELGQCTLDLDRLSWRASF